MKNDEFHEPCEILLHTLGRRNYFRRNEGKVDHKNLISCMVKQNRCFKITQGNEMWSSLSPFSLPEFHKHSLVSFHLHSGASRFIQTLSSLPLLLTFLFGRGEEQAHCFLVCSILRLRLIRRDFPWKLQIRS